MNKIRIIIHGFEHKSVDKSVGIIIGLARSSGSKVNGPIPLPTKKNIITVLRGVVKHKDSREQFERNKHKRLIILYPNSKTLDSLRRVQLPTSVDLLIKQF